MKYIIDVPKGFDYIIAYYSDNDGFPAAFTTVRAYDAEPYTEPEPDREQIRVGDEVEYFCGGNIRFVVCGIDNGVAYGFKYRPDFEDLDIGEYCEINELKKTGRHFPEVEKLLEEMRS